MRLRWVLFAGLALAVVLVATVVRDREPKRSEYCVAEVGQTRAQIDIEQARWTTLMAAISQRRGLPPRATTIAIATAFQESKIHNLDYGDRDSGGLFQQRPSQGWGTREQVRDPRHAIGKFYDALVKIKGYTNMSITEAAQRVQRSAYPGAYAQHEDYARALASSLRGYSPAAFNCRINATAGGRPDAVADDVVSSFGEIPIDVGERSVRIPLTGRAPDVEARGWGLAHYTVGNATRLKVSSVAFDGRVWSAKNSPDGWVADTRAASGAPDVVVIRVG